MEAAVDANLARLQEALSHAGIEALVWESALRLDGRDFHLRWRTAQPWTERLLEILTLHTLRTRRGQAADTILIIHVPRLPKRYPSVVLEEHRQLMRSGPLGNWMVLSDRGGIDIHFDHPKVDWTQADEHELTGPELAAAAIAHMRDPLRRDVTLAVLKVLLARVAKTKRSRWFTDASEALTATSIVDLAQRLRIASSSVYDVIGELRERNLVDVRRGDLPIVTDVPGVITWWLSGQDHVPWIRTPVMPRYDTSKRSFTATISWLSEQAKVGTSWALTGWAACRLHRALALEDADAKPVNIVIDGPTGPFLRQWELDVVPAHRAGQELFWITPTAVPRSTFLGVGAHQGVPVVDLWQAALDVQRDPHRGREQAQAIAQDLWLA